MNARVLVLLFALAACREHELQDGPFDFQLSQTVRDDCGLATLPNVVSHGTLRTTGDTVRLNYEFFDIVLTGSYEKSVERMSLDGSATNVSLNVKGTECLLDLVVMHLDATTRSATAFDGFASFSLETRRPESCVCSLWVGYTANRSP